jgi:cytochrome c peroxidase
MVLPFAVIATVGLLLRESKMKKLKVVVCTVFIVAGIFVAGYRASRVAGQVGQIAAPTRVNATDNLYNSKVGVYWDTMRGATLYRIFRNTANNSATATSVGTTSANFFFDTTVPANQTAFYWVRAENGAVLSQMSEPDTGIRTGTLQQGGTAPLGPPPNAPPGNPLTATKISLGKALFWDEQMSSTKTVSCGTCHHASSGGADPRITGINPGPDGLFNTGDDIRGSLGVPMNEPDGRYRFSATYGFGDQVTGRASMSYVNAAYAPILFWDGRATGQFNDPILNLPIFLNGASLESQSVGPPVSSVEMGHEGIDWTQVASRVAESKPLALSPSVPQSLQTWIDGRTYPELFLEAFGTAEVSPARIAMAIASFERSTFSDQTPWDLDVQGITPLTPQESMGRNLFNSGTFACGVCHGGNRFTDGAFHYIGVRPDTEDIGREAVTGMPNDRGAFRSPGLRNVGLRKSFFHNGKFTTLEEVIDFYDRGGDFDANNKPNLIHVLNLAPGQRAAILAFMRRPMTDPRVVTETGPFERPALYMGSNRVPQITGTGRAGSGGQTPQIKAISPPIVGNDKFTLSVSAALGNSSAVLVVDENDPGTPATIPTTGSLARVTATTQNTGAGNGWASVVIQIPDNASIVGRTFYARWYVTDTSAENGFSVSQAARFTVFGEASAPPRPAMFDFDGDGRTDIAVFRPENGYWYVLRSSDNTFVGQSFGLANDVMVPADYDGDGKTDAAVFRDGNWFMNRSRDGVQVVSWGVSGDIPQPGDYDGDGAVDIVVYRPSDGRWYISKSSGGVTVTPFGVAGDKPVATDFDGDGKTDIAVYRGGVWWVLGSTSGVTVANFGLADDRPVVGDYDGDGKADVAVYRPSSGTWFYIRSSDNAVTVASYGLAADVPVPGDYDGDGRNDLAVYRPTGGVWFSLNSGGTQKIQSWGLATDKPVPSSFVP